MLDLGFSSVYILFLCLYSFQDYLPKYYNRLKYCIWEFALFICHKTGTFATRRTAKLMTARKREELLQSKEAELTVMQEQLQTAKEELLRREAELDRRSSELAHVQVRLLQRFRETKSRN